MVGVECFMASRQRRSQGGNWSSAYRRRWPIESSPVPTDDTCRDLDLCDAITDIHYDRSSGDGDCEWNVGR